MKKKNINLLKETEWPASFPDRCANCENLYDPEFSHEIGPGKLARALRIAALILPAITLPLIILPKFKATPVLILTVFLVGTLIILSHLIPKKSRLHCHNCNSSEYLDPPNTWSHHGDN